VQGDGNPSIFFIGGASPNKWASGGCKQGDLQGLKKKMGKVKTRKVEFIPEIVCLYHTTV